MILLRYLKIKNNDTFLKCFFKIVFDNNLEIKNKVMRLI